MKKFWTDIFIFLGIVVFAFVALMLVIGNTAADIQLHDTYFYASEPWGLLSIIAIGPPTFLIFLGRGLTLRFRTVGANVGLAIGIILTALLIGTYTWWQNVFLDFTSESNFAPETIAKAQRNVNLGIALLVLWIVGFIVLTIRTIKILRKPVTEIST